MDRAFLSALAGFAIVASATTPLPVSHQIAGGVANHVIADRETLNSIGARAGVDISTLASANGVQAGGAKLKAGPTLIVDNRHLVPVVRASIVINIPQRMLFLIEDGRVELAFPVALGRPGWQTPTGPFTILKKEIDPTWHVPVSIQREMVRAGRPLLTEVRPGPGNPLGDRRLVLDLPGIGIHGTDAPASIYHHQTHGCIRLHPDDIHELFECVQAGATGEIVYEPVLLGEFGGRVYVESHRDVYRRVADPMGRLRASADASGLTPVIDWVKAARVVRESAGIAYDVTAAR